MNGGLENIWKEEFACRDEGKPREALVRIADAAAENLIRYLRNANQNFYPMELLSVLLCD
jgi:hypothetical protein